jgi:hypothetical protein
MACCAGCDVGLGDCFGRPSMGNVYGDCDNFQAILTADQVVPFRTRIGAEFDRTNAAVLACGTLSPEERAAWNATYAGWRALAAQDVTWWNANSVARSMCAMGLALERERETLRAKCVAVGPSIVVNQPHDPSELPSVLKWVAGAAIVVAGVYALKTILP